MTQYEIEQQIAEIDRDLKKKLDPLENWKEGYRKAHEDALELIYQTTGKQFKDMADLIVYIRKND